ncbi:NAD(P)-dependent oxidoreductase [Streptomyces sp. 130]|uniref:NAD-dependent epimerase/dehydratase family protein n=1 Tax=Streptomyces sp. 130 TaxID=2591006 RepID=UPI00117F542C|nr:NAD(P)-dependent oxidoreductase [Streptomyces sp. 130]TRV75597.1 NAD(P)-dependent oxidoreductase [Streptomyces sp. 130]
MRVVITGATGFIGSAVVNSLARTRDAAADHLHLTAIGRSSGRAATTPCDDWHHADLADPDSLSRSCEGADVLLHLGGTLGPDPQTCHTVNVAGTAALMREARRARVGRIVHLSTAAVYGKGPHHGPDIGEVEPAPVSAASATRLQAERYALDAGATVLRPGLVLGRGDRWVIPALHELTARVPALWGGGRARLSAVVVERLAALVTALALRPGPTPAGVFHASHPQPVTVGQLLTALAGLGVLPPVTEPWPWDRCLTAFHATHGTRSERQFHLLAQDHWYRSDTIWKAAAQDPGPPPQQDLEPSAAWYRDLVTAG